VEYFSRLPAKGMTVYHSLPGIEQNHSENLTEENTYLKQMRLLLDLGFFIE
jgi:hypothetical protein